MKELKQFLIKSYWYIAVLGLAIFNYFTPLV